MERTQLFFLSLIAFGLTTACGTQDEGTDGPAPIKVGAIFDLTGSTSDVGAIYAEGIRGYVDCVNEHGGIEGHELDLIFQDYAYKVDQAEQLYT